MNNIDNLKEINPNLSQEQLNFSERYIANLKNGIFYDENNFDQNFYGTLNLPLLNNDCENLPIKDYLEKSFDKALQEQVDRVKIIHGHGTEALKKSVRKYLSRSVYIQKWQASSETSHDDGYTWADLS